MRMLKCAGVALALALSACATGSTSGWPDPKIVGTALTTAEMAWNVYCAQPGNKAVCTANKKTVADAESAAATALNTYAEAYQSGSVTQALLDNATALIQYAVQIMADIKGKHADLFVPLNNPYGLGS